jgi:hypothetical protein
MEELIRFEELLLSSLSNIDDSYYRTTYENIHAFREELVWRRGILNENSFDRFGERVFCYELYHQLRILIDIERKHNPSFLEGTNLQGEVQKWLVHGLNARLGLEDLSKEFVPDFLMHSPGEASRHVAVIEVKCYDRLTTEEVLYDLNKLDEFIRNYYYERGFFISVNMEFDSFIQLMHHINNQISTLSDSIKIICKTNSKVEAQYYNL